MIIYIPGDPVGKERPRVANGHAYTPEKTKAYEAKVAWAWKKKYPSHKPFQRRTALSARVTARFQPPKSESKKKRADMLNGKIRPTKIPDIDNICKALLDGSLGVCYEDDSSVVELTATKVYSESPGVLLEVREIDGANSP